MNSLNNVNGEYQMTLVGANGAGGSTIIWDLGNIKAWFREGQQLTTNNHIPASFTVQEEIKASYPPPDNQGIIAVTGAFCLALLGAFTYYFLQQMHLQKAMENFSAGGALLTLVLIGGISALVSFWLGYINLLQLLTLDVISAPFALFIVHKGLQGTKVKV